MTSMLNLNVNYATRHARAYLELCKPRVVALMILTSIAGMFLAENGNFSFTIFSLGNLGIALVAASGAAINHICDRHFDELMHRTKFRPLPRGQISLKHALIFALLLAIIGMTILFVWINALTAWLTLSTMIGYALVYTLFLKHATSHNIVIGGLAGATPPLLGWTAVTNCIDPKALILVLIIFTWTPPHFWALAIHRYKEYEKANIPMLPVTHGLSMTKFFIFLYTILLVGVSLLPFTVSLTGPVYLFSALILGLIYLYYSAMLMWSKDPRWAMRSFRFSILYLMLLFAILLFDHSSVTTLLNSK